MYTNGTSRKKEKKEKREGKGGERKEGEGGRKNQDNVLVGNEKCSISRGHITQSPSTMFSGRCSNIFYQLGGALVVMQVTAVAVNQFPFYTG